MRDLSPRPLAVAVAVLAALLIAPICAWADVGVLGVPPPTPPGPFTNPPAFGREPAPTWSWQASASGGGATILRYHVMVSQDSGATWRVASPATVPAAEPATSWRPSWPGFAADGIYQIKVQAEDGDHVLSEWGYSSTYVLDRVPPQVALTVPETGLETNNVDIVMRGTASDSPWGVAAVHWEVRDPDGRLVAGVARFGEPDASFTPSAPLSIQGEYIVRLNAEDRAGNLAVTTERTFKLDTIAPEMSLYELLVTPSRMLQGDVYISDSQPRIKVVAVDTLGGSGFNVDGQLDIEVFADSETPQRVSGTVTRTPTRPGDDGGSWTALWSPSGPMASGRYYSWITIVDDAGNKLERGGAAHRFVIDAAPPGMSGDSSVGQANTNSGRHFTNSRRPVITWSRASDPDLANGVVGAGVAGYEPQVWTKQEGQSAPSGTQIYSAPGTVDPWADQMPVTCTGGSIEQHTPGSDLSFQNGASYGAWIRARDRVGNASAWVDPPFVFDSDPPSMPGGPSLAGVTGGRVATGRPTIRWAHATDAKVGVSQSGVDGYQVRIKHAGSTSWDVLNAFVDLDPDEDVCGMDGDSPLAGDFDWTVPQLLADGAYELELRARDVAGNASDWSAVLEFEVDATPPAAPAITALAPGYNTSPLTLQWNAVADRGNAIAYVLQWAKDAGFSGAHDIAIDAEAGTEYAFEFTDQGRGEGEYWFRVKTVSTLSGAGGVKESGWSLSAPTVYDTTGPEAPVLTLLTPNPTNESPQTWSWSAPDGAAGYKASVDGASWIDVHNTFGYQTAFDATGTHTFAVKAYDWLRNDGAQATGSIEIDVTPPDIPIRLVLVSESVIIDGVPHTADTTPTIKWDSSEDAVNHRVEIDGQAWIYTADNVYEFTEGLEKGEHTVRVAAADDLGNWSDYSSPLVFVIDVTPPLPPGRPSATSPTNNRNPVWIWAAAEGSARYRVFEDGVDKGFATAPTFTSANLPEGSHYLQVTALDELGNESERSASGTVEIDLTPPDPPRMQSLPAFTSPTANGGRLVFQWVAGANAVRFDLKYSIGDLDPVIAALSVTRYELDISGLDNGLGVQGQVRAYDDAGNCSEWSERASTTIDSVGPAVRIVLPATEVHTNMGCPVWKWEVVDDDTAPIEDYRVTLVAGEHALPEIWTSSSEFMPVPDLGPGAYVLRVAARDELGNIGTEESFPVVHVVAPVIHAPIPMEGAYPVNKVSTIAFSVSGMWDARLKVFANGRPVPDRSVIVVSRPSGFIKFYVLIDADMAEPGERLTIRVEAGSAAREVVYEVLAERSGFGFGRLRPWDW